MLRKGPAYKTGGIYPNIPVPPVAVWSCAEVVPGEVGRGRFGSNPRFREHRLLLVHDLLKRLARPAPAAWPRKKI